MKQQKQTEAIKDLDLQTKKSKITKNGNVWVYADDEMLLASSSRTDKQFMIWKDKENV